MTTKEGRAGPFLRIYKQTTYHMLFNVTRWVVGVAPTSSSVQLIIMMMNYTNDTPNTHTRDL